MKSKLVGGPFPWGFKVLVIKGVEISSSDPRAHSATEKLNGPHQEAVWAKRLLGTDISQGEYRRRRILSQQVSS